MYDHSTHLMVLAAEQRERHRQVAADNRARRVARLRRLDRRVTAAENRARLARLALG